MIKNKKEKSFCICRPPILKTFELPSRENLLNIKIGNYVKLIFGLNEKSEKERMWVEVTDIKGTYGYGKLANTPIFITTLSYGDRIKFHLGDVIAIKKSYD